MILPIKNQKSKIKNGVAPCHDAIDRWTPRVFLFIAAVMVLARLWLVFHRLYDPDELQHLHAGYCIWQGMVPYRDFFEQHEPALWYLSLPLFMIWGESLTVLFALRVIIWCSGAATFLLTWRLGDRLYGRWGGAIAALMLAIYPLYQEKNVECRPDNLAVPLVLVAVECLSRAFGSRGPAWAALAGVALACGFFCTQKIAYVGSGVVGAFAVAALLEARRSKLPQALTQPGSRKASPAVPPTSTPVAPALSRSGATRPDEGGRETLRDLTPPQPERVFATKQACGLLAAVVVGAGSIATLVVGLFVAQEAAGPFLSMTIVLPLEWKTQEPALRYLVSSLSFGNILWGAAAGGLVLSLPDFFQSQARRDGRLLIAGGAAAHAAGLLVVPAPFLQYYLPLVPLAALLAARAVASLAGRVRDGRVLESAGRELTLVATIVALTLAVIGLAARSLMATLSSAWPMATIMLFVVASIACAAGWRRLGVCILLCVAGAGGAEHHAIQFRHWRHEPQTRRIQQLMHASNREDRFFDGFTGYGALRPHAFFYFWINDHSWPMIAESEQRHGVLEALADSRTRVVLFDAYLRRYLPMEARKYLADNFEPDARLSDPVVPGDNRGVLVYVRRGRRLPDVPADAPP